MKKFFSLFALAGLLVACQPEELQTVIGDVPGATATFNLTVTDLATGTTLSDTDYKFAISGLTGVLEGNTFRANTNESLKGTATVTVTYKGEESSQSVDVDVPAGGSISYPFSFTVGHAASEYTLDLDEEASTTDFVDPKSFYLEATDGKYTAHSHNGGTYFWNNTDYLLSGKVTYPTYTGANVVSYTAAADAHKAGVKSYASVLGAGYAKNDNGGTLDIVVSAHCYYAVLCTVSTKTTVYNVKYGNDVVGTITTEQYSSAATYDEVDDGTGHYTHGHGHGDGSANAGGGIVTSE